MQGFRPSLFSLMLLLLLRPDSSNACAHRRRPAPGASSGAPRRRSSLASPPESGLNGAPRSHEGQVDANHTLEYNSTQTLVERGRGRGRARIWDARASAPRYRVAGVNGGRKAWPRTGPGWAGLVCWELLGTGDGGFWEFWDRCRRWMDDTSSVLAAGTVGSGPEQEEESTTIVRRASCDGSTGTVQSHPVQFSATSTGGAGPGPGPVPWSGIGGCAGGK